MNLLIAALAIWIIFLIALLGASVAATIRHFGGRGWDDGGSLAPMTLIKPVRGLDDALEESFRSILACDPEGRLQILVAMESEADPAYGPLSRLAAAYPARDIEFVFAGPSAGRMGKIHNMIAAWKRAKHPYVVFSDADTSVTPRLLRQTSEAFLKGYDAVFALPYHPPAPGLGGYAFQIAFNHCFAVAAALSYYLGIFRFCAGAWMGYTKQAIERAGGLEPFAHSIADDFAISGRAFKTGAKACLLREYVRVRETGTSLRQAYDHIVKWSAIIHSCLPRLYWVIPCVNIGLCSTILWAVCEGSGRYVGLGRCLLAAGLIARGAASFVQDAFSIGAVMPWPVYPALCFADFGTLVFWAAGFRKRITWRGTRYRLAPGGRAEVLA